MRNDISNFGGFCYGCTNMEQFNIDNIICPTDMAGMFYNCSSLTLIDITKFNITNTISLGYLFNGCTLLNTIIGLEKLNVENVQNIHYAFAGTSITNVDLSKWNFKKLTSIKGLFEGCKKLQSVNLTGVDISKVNSLYALFNGCHELTSIKGIEDWNTSNIENTSGTFRELRTLKTLDLSNWNVSNVTNMVQMFNGCSSLEILKLTNFNTSNVSKAANMFNGCISLKEYDIVITFGSNMPFNEASFDKSIKYITIKGTPDIIIMNSFVNILKDQTDTVAILDISQLSDEIKSSLMGNATLVNNARAKGWTFRQYSLDFNIFEIEANDTNGMLLTLYENPDKIGEATTYTTDWGDGTVDNNTSHTYSTVGTYTIKTKLQPNNINTKNDNKLIKKVLNIRNDISNLSYFCCGCLNMEQFSIDNIINATNMRSMFYRCKSLTSLDVSNFNTSNVTDMSWMFHSCNSLTSLDISNFDTLNVTDMSVMFYNCYYLTSLDVSNFDTSNVTNMSWMFCGCSSLTSLDVSNFDTSKVTNMSLMFSCCDSLTSLDLSNFDTLNVTNMSEMFDSCSSLRLLNLVEFHIKPSVDVSSSLTSVPSDAIVKVTSSFEKTEADCNWKGQFYIVDLIMKYTYTGTSNIIPALPSDYTYTLKDVTNSDGSTTRSLYNSNWIGPNTYYEAFSSIADKNNITSIDYMRIDNNCTDLSNCFNGCNSIANISFSRYNDTSNVTNMSNMFSNCMALTSLDLFNFNTSNVTDMSYMFIYCMALISLDISNFNTSNVTNMSFMFIGCSSLTSLDVSNFNTSNVTNMSNIFAYCSKLTSLDVSNFNTSNVANMSYMFSDCRALTSLDLSNFNTSLVTNMYGIFSGCNSLTSLDLSNFNTSLVTDMRYMFYKCNSLTSLDISNFNTSNVTDMSYMFRDCSSLTSLDLTSFNIKSSVSSTNSLLNVPSDAIVRVTSSFEKTEANCNWTGTFKRPMAFYKYTNLVEDGDNSYIADTSGNNYNIGLGFLPTEVTEKGIYINGRSSSPSISYPINENGFTIKYKVYNMDAGSGATFFKCMSGSYTNNLGWWLGIGDSNIKVRTKNVWFKSTRHLSDNDFMDENSSPMIYQFNEVVLSMNKNKLYLNVNGVIYRNTNLNITSSFDSLAISLIADSAYTQSARYYFYKSEVYNEYLEI